MSENAIIRVLELLKAMHNNRRSEIRWRVDNPASVARRLREAIKVAPVYGDYKHFADLTNVYKIRIYKDQVIVTPRTAVASTISLDTDATPVQIHDEKIDLFQIIGLLLLNKPKAIMFKNPLVTDTELGRFFTWCQQHGYYIINHEEAGITVTQNDPGELRWIPKEQ
jgi:hypothetical protein